MKTKEVEARIELEGNSVFQSLRIERDILLAVLKATPCFGCGVKFGEPEIGGCVNCSRQRAAINKAENAEKK